MRFRQAQRRRGAALGATPPPLAVASLPAVLSSVGQRRRVVTAYDRRTDELVARSIGSARSTPPPITVGRDSVEP